jgi:hypothetical protein
MKIIQAIQIGDNVTDIMKLPCIINAWKFPRPQNLQDKFPLRGHYPDKGDIVYSFLQGMISDFAMKGDWLCELDNGVWKVLSDKDYRTLTEGNVSK